MTLPSTKTERVPTGIQGLDAVLRGGLVKGSSYVLDGSPGAGKTTLEVAIGEPLKKFSGILTGVPRYLGAPEHLLDIEPEDHEGTETTERRG